MKGNSLDSHIILNEVFSSLIQEKFPQITALNKRYIKAQDKERFFKEECVSYERLQNLQKFLQYVAVTNLLNNITDNQVYIAQTSLNKAEVLKFPLTAQEFLKLFSQIKLEPVLTAHPTEPFSNEALKEIDIIQSHLEKSPLNPDQSLISTSLEKLMLMSLVPCTKLSVGLEIAANMIYFRKIYLAATDLRQTILEAFSANFPARKKDIEQLKFLLEHTLRPRSWSGGDADGNIEITPEATLNAVIMQSKFVIEWHLKFFAKHLLSQDLPSLILEELHPLRNTLSACGKSVKRIEQDYNLFLAQFKSFQEKHHGFIFSHPEFAAKLESFKFLLITFGFHLAQIDTRQNARLLKQVFNELSETLKQEVTHSDILEKQTLRELILDYYKQGKFHGLICETELKRVELMAKFPNILTHFILSNTESEDDILRALALCKLFSAAPNIVPLFESNSAIQNATKIITSTLSNTHYKAFLKNKIQKVMVGYSDSERESGVFILPLIYGTVEKLKALFKEQQIPHSIFHGNGLDLARGGPTVFAPEQTIQGNQKRYFFMTKHNTLNYFLRSLNAAIYSTLKTLDYTAAAKLFHKGVDAFEALFKVEENRKQLEHYLFYASPFWLYVKPNNYSSRTTRRNENEESSPYRKWLNPEYYPQGKVLNGIRAISQVNTIEGTFTNFNLWYGLKEILENLKVEQYKDYPIVDAITKALIGIELADFETALRFISERTQDPTATFPLALEKTFAQTLRLVSLHKLSLPSDILLSLQAKKQLAQPIKEFIAFSNRELIFNQAKRNAIRELFQAEVDDALYLELISQMFGAVYCGFTEYRTPSYKLMERFFNFFIQA